jgi:hypothetical protein
MTIDNAKQMAHEKHFLPNAGSYTNCQSHDCGAGMMMMSPQSAQLQLPIPGEDNECSA